MTKVDPYAAPKSDEAAPERKRRRAMFERERRPVALVLLLSVLTLGLYTPIWYIRRAQFLNALKADQSLPPSLPWVLLVVMVLTFFVALLAGNRDFSQPITIGSGILDLVIRFRIARMLRSHFARTGRFISVSGVATFFLGILYLQWKINQAADTPPVRKRKRKST